jgi:hypothetical protein
MSSNSVVSQKMSGIQLALFELIWPTFDWIDAVYIASDATDCSVHVRVAHLPPDNERDDCERLLREIFDAVLMDTKLRFAVTQDKRPPVRSGYQEAISQEIFKKIAKDIAPWRLEAGR